MEYLIYFVLFCVFVYGISQFRQKGNAHTELIETNFRAAMLCKVGALDGSLITAHLGTIKDIYEAVHKRHNHGFGFDIDQSLQIEREINLKVTGMAEFFRAKHPNVDLQQLASGLYLENMLHQHISPIWQLVLEEQGDITLFQK
ncbi:hypothetical protein WH95_19810 [Kiloniella litopenaei]|uniref:Uncharacterized protein n=1 Tax=Kiloniella litopenaei TaxID=1549748 RepID=A0A0M2R6P2_9PROT|nr:hypothetical protein [Kiloniella litopenaei]KKJ75168.1 hypothetical protein WH95_19810 [Kiloniella litopenaei]